MMDQPHKDPHVIHSVQETAVRPVCQPTYSNTGQPETRPQAQQCYAAILKPGITQLRMIKLPSSLAPAQPIVSTLARFSHLLCHPLVCSKSMD